MKIEEVDTSNLYKMVPIGEYMQLKDDQAKLRELMNRSEPTPPDALQFHAPMPQPVPLILSKPPLPDRMWWHDRWFRIARGTSIAKTTLHNNTTAYHSSPEETAEDLRQHLLKMFDNNSVDSRVSFKGRQKIMGIGLA